MKYIKLLITISLLVVTASCSNLNNNEAVNNQVVLQEENRLLYNVGTSSYIIQDYNAENYEFKIFIAYENYLALFKFQNKTNRLNQETIDLYAKFDKDIIYFLNRKIEKDGLIRYTSGFIEAIKDIKTDISLTLIWIHLSNNDTKKSNIAFFL